MGSIGMDEMPLRSTTPDPLASSILPSSKATSLSVVPADKVERIQCWHINSHSWRGPLSLPQYLGREVHLERQALVADGRITFWILTFADQNSRPTNADADQPARPILASCESLLKSAYVAKGGHLKRIQAHGIGYVVDAAVVGQLADFDHQKRICPIRISRKGLCKQDDG